MAKRLSYLLFSLFLAACAGSGSGELEASGKNLALTVSGSRSFNPDIVHGQIDYYRISITAPDLKIPFTQRFGGKTSSASLMGIPSGADRTVTIEAVNPNGLVIRRGKKEGLSIVPGQVSKAEISMVSVPIFTNVADKAAVAAGRLVFEVFAEPGSRIQILEDGTPIADQNSRSTWLDTQASAEGISSLVPGPMGSGTRAFEVRDAETGEFSRISVALYRRTVRPGLSVNSGGSIRNQGDELVIRASGQPYFREAAPENESLSNATFLDVVEMLY